MSIEYSDGDIFESGCQALVCPVNCVGVMGAGLALEFKKRWPSYFRDYKDLCDNVRIFPGSVRLHYAIMPGKVIVSFPTKEHWKDKSQLWVIEQGLRSLLAAAVAARVAVLKSIAVPALGCGLGGLKWEEVKPLIEKYLGDLDCRVVVFPPKEKS